MKLGFSELIVILVVSPLADFCLNTICFSLQSIVVSSWAKHCKVFILKAIQNKMASIKPVFLIISIG